MLPAILGFAGPVLTGDERAFFKAADPAGYVLFRRNVADPAQLRALTDALRDLSGRGDLAIMVDQEGGRVTRLAPPAFPAFPAQGCFAALYEKAPISAIEAARVNAQALAVTLAEAGINVDLLPVLDLRVEGQHDIVGDRALGAEPMQVAALGGAVLDGLEAGGAIGVVKHMPGHGRARTDSHKELPIVDTSAAELETDIAPFRSLSGAPMAMTAHVLYPAWDAERAATVSPTVIAEVIRGEIGFDGLLMTDDLAMEALSGSHAERASTALAAGCDLALFCTGVLADNEAVAGALGPIGDKAAERLTRAMARTGRASTQGYEALAAKRDALLALIP